MTRPTLAAVVVVLGASLSACGGGSGAPTDAAVTEFCQANGVQNLAIVSIGGEPSEKQVADAFDGYADKLAAIGTPDGAPGDARAGFEVLVERLRDAHAGGTTGWDRMQMDAFDDYVAETCAEEDLGLPQPPALPTD